VYCSGIACPLAESQENIARILSLVKDFYTMLQHKEGEVSHQHCARKVVIRRVDKSLDWL